MKIIQNEEKKFYISRLTCPSQAFFYFTDKHDEHWCLYLRWRRNPWGVMIVPIYQDETKTDWSDFDNWKWDWEGIVEVPTSRDYKEEEDCQEVVRESYAWVRSNFPELKLPKELGEDKIYEEPFPELDVDEILGGLEP